MIDVTRLREIIREEAEKDAAKVVANAPAPTNLEKNLSVQTSEPATSIQAISKVEKAVVSPVARDARRDVTEDRNNTTYVSRSHVEEARRSYIEPMPPQPVYSGYPVCLQVCDEAVEHFRKGRPSEQDRFFQVRTAEAHLKKSGQDKRLRQYLDSGPEHTKSSVAVVDEAVNYFQKKM